MPTFCRHNRLLQNCTICAREQNFEARPVVSSSAPKSTQPREAAERGPGEARAPRAPRAPRTPTTRSAANAVRVRQLARGAEDGFRSPLVPGLKSSQDAERLTEEIAFATWRLSLMEQVAAGEAVAEAPVSWSEIAADGDLDARTLDAARHVLNGPRGLEDGTRLEEAVLGLEAWGGRSGGLPVAFSGETSWSPERRFERTFERLGGVHGLDRDIRYELLTLLGRLGLYELRAGKLFPGGENEATWAAKRALGIGDPLLLERRAAELAEACGAPIEALDLGLHNWGSGARVADGLPEDAVGDEAVLEQARSSLGL
ncbi:MAG: hypothetical protein FWD04_09785 [Conexibacteraceae bacterium]|nr:hypothetical protein [Conexibacteraceae bacterium]